jgi:hypothetical protein
MTDPLPVRSRMSQPEQLDRADYRTLSDFRYLIRRFLGL